MNWFLVVRLLHILSAIVFVGGIFARQLVRVNLNKAENVRTVAELLQAVGRIESMMVIPGNLAVLVFGIILAILIKAPAFGFLQGASQNWLLVSNILLVIGLSAVPLVFVPRGKRMEPVLKAALAEQRITPELRATLNDTAVRFIHYYEEVALVIVVALMVLKPF